MFNVKKRQSSGFPRPCVRPSFVLPWPQREEPKEFISTTVDGFLNSGFEAVESKKSVAMRSKHHGYIWLYMVINGYILGD